MSGILKRAADLNNLNYTVQVPYNGTVPTGGDSLHENLNVFYEVDEPRHQNEDACEADSMYSLAI